MRGLLGITLALILPTASPAAVAAPLDAAKVLRAAFDRDLAIEAFRLQAAALDLDEKAVDAQFGLLIKTTAYANRIPGHQNFDFVRDPFRRYFQDGDTSKTGLSTVVQYGHLGPWDRIERLRLIFERSTVDLDRRRREEAVADDVTALLCEVELRKTLEKVILDGVKLSAMLKEMIARKARSGLADESDELRTLVLKNWSEKNYDNNQDRLEAALAKLGGLTGLSLTAQTVDASSFIAEHLEQVAQFVDTTMTPQPLQAELFRYYESDLERDRLKAEADQRRLKATLGLRQYTPLALSELSVDTDGLLSGTNNLNDLALGVPITGAYQSYLGYLKLDILLYGSSTPEKRGQIEKKREALALQRESVITDAVRAVDSKKSEIRYYLNLAQLHRTNGALQQRLRLAVLGKYKRGQIDFSEVIRAQADLVGMQTDELEAMLQADRLYFEARLNLR